MRSGNIFSWEYYLWFDYDLSMSTSSIDAAISILVAIDVHESDLREQCSPVYWIMSQGYPEHGYFCN